MERYACEQQQKGMDHYAIENVSATAERILYRFDGVRVEMNVPNISLNSVSGVYLFLNFEMDFCVK